VALDANVAAFHLALGDSARQSGDLVIARRAFSRGIALAPADAEGFSLLGLSGEQSRTYRLRAVVLDPTDAAAWCNLGDAELASRRPAWAIVALRKSMALMPDLAEAHANRAGAGIAFEDWSTVEAAARRALALAPLHPGAISNLAGALRWRGKVVAARRCCRQALALAPSLPSAFGEMAMILLSLASAEDAAAADRRALAIERNETIGSNLVFALCYVPGIGPEAVLAEARRQAPRSVAALPARHRSVRQQLVVGYLSPDLGRHPVGYFLLPVLENHDPHRVRAICYSTRRAHDGLTHRLRSAASLWIEAAELDDSALAKRIELDGVDILIDLAGHTAGARLGVFARRAAPVQATWAGFPGPSGVAAMDYVIADAVEIPPGAEAGYGEHVMRLPGSYVCFAPVGYAPDPGELPALSRGAVTFGCFNNVAKFNDTVFRTWARILAATPGSRLLLRWSSLLDAEVASEIGMRLVACGIMPGLVDISGCRDHAELLTAYRNVDIALDPFPYTGGLTTLEALWMGVPVVTIAGRTFAGRHGASHLTAAGLGDWIAGSVEGYVALAVERAARLDDLGQLRDGLRSRLKTTTLVDGAAFTRNLEAAYEAMWRGETRPV
jgi:predicted O-linked N-acetylglucosamine transferase (SPINDLY family)